MNELGLDLVINAIVSDLDRLRTALAGTNSRRCCLCSSTGYNVQKLEYDIESIFYDAPCPKCDELALRILRVEALITEGPHEVRVGTTAMMDCYKQDCDGPLVPPLADAVEARRISHTLPLSQILNLRIENHHVSYDPEVTIPVCKSCHMDIHHGNNGLAPLQPEQSRSEWEDSHE